MAYQDYYNIQDQWNKYLKLIGREIYTEEDLYFSCSYRSN